MHFQLINVPDLCVSVLHLNRLLIHLTAWSQQNKQWLTKFINLISPPGQGTLSPGEICQVFEMSWWNETSTWALRAKCLLYNVPVQTLYTSMQSFCDTFLCMYVCKDKRPFNKQLVGFQLSLKEQQRHAEKHFQRAAPSFQYRPTAIHSGRKMTQTKLLSAAAAKAWTFKAKRKHASLSGDYSTSDVAAAHRCRLA